MHTTIATMVRSWCEANAFEDLHSIPKLTDAWGVLKLRAFRAHHSDQHCASPLQLINLSKAVSKRRANLISPHKFFNQVKLFCVPYNKNSFRPRRCFNLLLGFIRSSSVIGVEYSVNLFFDSEEMSSQTMFHSLCSSVNFIFVCYQPKLASSSLWYHIFINFVSLSSCKA